MEALNHADGHRDSGEHPGTKRLVKESALSLGGTVFAGTLSLVIPIIVTRQIPAADAGIYFEAVALFMVLLNVGALGADTGVLRFLPRALAQDEPRLVTVYLRTALWIPVACAAVVGITVAMAAPTLASLMLHAGNAHQQTMIWCLYVTAMSLPPAVAYLVSMAATRGLHSIRMLVLVDKIAKGALQLGLVTAAVAIGGSVAGAVAGWTFAYALCLVVVGGWLLAYFRNRRAEREYRAPSWPERRELVRSFWGFSLPRAVSRVCNVAMQRGDIVLVGALLGPSDAALYAAATRFVVLGTLLAQAIQQVMAPKVSAAVSVDDLATARSVYRLTTTWLTLLAWPVYLVAANFAVLLLEVFGDAYPTAWPAAVILCLTMLVATACGPVDTVLLMAGRSTLSLLNALVALTAMLGVDLLLVPRLGISGAAIGWGVAIVTNNLLALAQVRAIFSIHPFGRGFFTAAGIALGCYGMIPFIVTRAIGTDVPSLALSAVVSLAISSVFIARNLTVLGLDSLRGTRLLRRF